MDRFGDPAFDGRERLVEEAAPSTRTETQRDRDRILYSSAFLRLGHVTQVTAPETGRVFHTRLTHSLKVAQVARRTAESLPALRDAGVLKDDRFREVDPDLVEAAALAHDLGHPPFGHIAEEELHRASLKAGGFEGNAQSFRIVARLALRDWMPGDQREPYEGLNLTWRVLNGLVKYPTAGQPSYGSGVDASSPPKIGAYHSEGHLLQAVRTEAGYTSQEKCLAAQLMDWADDLTYAVHDVEDFFRAGILPVWQLADLDERQRFLEYQDALHTRRGGTPPDPDRVDVLLRELADRDVSRFAIPFDGSTSARAELRNTTSNYIGRYVAALRQSESPDERPEPSLAPIPALRDEVTAFKDLLWFYVIEDAPLATVQHGQRRMVRRLHRWYLALTEREPDWRHFPPLYREWLRSAQRSESRDPEVLTCRIVTDFIADMTEDQVAELYQRLGGYTSPPVYGGRASG